MVTFLRASFTMATSQGQTIGACYLVCLRSSWAAALLLGGVPPTLDPNTSANVSRYKWEPCCDTIWWCIYYFLPRAGNALQKHRDRNGRCIAILFKSIEWRGHLTLLILLRHNKTQGCKRIIWINNFQKRGTRVANPPCMAQGCPRPSAPDTLKDSNNSERAT